MNEVEELALDSVASGGPEEVLTEQANNNPDVPEVDPVDTTALPKEDTPEKVEFPEIGSQVSEVEPDNTEDVFVAPEDMDGGFGLADNSEEELEDPDADLTMDELNYDDGGFKGELTPDTVNLAGVMGINPKDLLKFIEKYTDELPFVKQHKAFRAKQEALQNEVTRVNENVNLSPEEQQAKIRKILEDEGVTYGQEEVNWLRLSDNEDLNDISNEIFTDPMLNDGIIGNVRVIGTKDGVLDPTNRKIPEDLDIEKGIAYIARRYAKAFDAESGGAEKMSFELMQHISDITLLSDKKALSRILANKPGEIPPMPYVMAMSTLYNIESRKLNAMISKIRTGEDKSDAFILEARRQFEIVANVQLKISGIKTNLGRGLVALRRGSDFGPENQVVQRQGRPESFATTKAEQSDNVVDGKILSEEEALITLDTLGGKEKITQFFSNWQDLPENRRHKFTRQFYKYAKEGKTAQYFERANEFWVNALLSSPLSHMRNIFGNLLMLGKNTLEQYAMGTVGSTANALGLDYGGLKLDEVNNATLATIMSVWEGLSAMGSVSVGGAKPQQIGAQTKIDLPGGRQRAISSESIMNTSASDPDLPMVGHMINGLGKTINFPTGMLDAEDVFFKVLAQRHSISIEAQRSAKSKGLTGDEKINYIAEFMADPPEEALLRSQKDADYLTFQSELKGNAKDMQKIISSSGLRWFMPFFKTPYNIAMVTFRDGSPLGLIHGEAKRKILSGTAREREEAITRMASGSMLMFVGYQLADNVYVDEDGTEYPRMTGGTLKSEYSEKGKIVRNTKRVANIPDYSYLVIGKDGSKKYVPYRGFEPFSSWMMIGKDFHKILNDPELIDDEDTITQRFWGGVLALENAILNKTFAQGADTFIKVAFEPERYGENWLYQMASSFTPAVIKQMAKIVDPVLRQHMDIIDKINTGIPWLSDTVNPYLDLHGREMKQSKIGWSSFFNPFASKPFAPEQLTNLQKDWFLFGAGPSLVKPRYSFDGVNFNFTKMDNGKDMYLFLQKEFAKDYNIFIEPRLKADRKYQVNKQRFIDSGKTDLEARDTCIGIASRQVNARRRLVFKRILARPRNYKYGVEFRNHYDKEKREQKLLQIKGY
jgi:hypothetical protein